MTQLIKPPSLGDHLGTIRRQEAREHSRHDSYVFYGPRNDSPYGGEDGPRVQVGLLSDGTYGVERWDADGGRTTPTWA